MFKVGDKIVCVDAGSSGHLKQYNFYIIEEFHIASSTKKPLITLYETDYYHSISRFVSIKEYRKLKLKKIRYNGSI